MTREEAIETIKKVLPMSKSLEDAFYILHPELCDGEDERIKKEMVEFLKQYKEDGLRGVDITPWIAYLEKQKEQKPAEWSEEDREMLNSVLLYFNAPFHDMTDGELKAFNWLKSLPERFILQPKQEWSEEDEKTINDACCWIAEYSGYLMDKNYGKASMLMSLTNKLKSLRPKPYTVSTKDTIKFGNLEYERCVKDGVQSKKNRQWKPSEEQLKILNWAANGMVDKSIAAPEMRAVLRELYDELKKLM